MKTRIWTLLGLLLTVAAGIGLGNVVFRQMQPEARIVWPGGFQVFPSRLVRPYGMAPVAFDAFVRACHNAKVDPNRLGQTLGDHPRSVGYHRRDGVLTLNGQKIEYSAAVDIGTWSLDEKGIDRFLEALAQQGFAAFYRSGPRWRGNEHIHAIYALLPMKPQLRRQVRQFLRERREIGKPRLKWERKMRQLWQRLDYV